MKCAILIIAAYAIVATKAESMESSSSSVPIAGNERDLGNKNKKYRKKNKQQGGWPQPYWPKPTPKPSPKPVAWPVPKWSDPCFHDYETQYPAKEAGNVNAVGVPIDANAGGVVGDYNIHSGDLYVKGLGFKIGFLQQVDVRMEDYPPGDQLFEVFGAIQVKNFGQVTYSGFHRAKNTGLLDTNNRGPLQTYAITGGTEAFEHAGGEITCRRLRLSAGPPADFDLLITVKPKCLKYSSDYYQHYYWP